MDAHSAVRVKRGRKFRIESLSEAKDAIRVLHADYARSLLSAADQAVGRGTTAIAQMCRTVLMLAGPTPHVEIEVWRRAFLRVYVTAVDCVQEFVDAAKYAGVDNAVCAPVETLLARGGVAYDVINLDLCGHPDASMAAAVSRAASQLQPHGVLMVTFSYGHTWEGGGHVERLARAAHSVIGRGRQPTSAKRARIVQAVAARECVAAAVLAAAHNLSALSICAVTTYFSNMPMCAVIYQRGESQRPFSAAHLTKEAAPKVCRLLMAEKTHAHMTPAQRICAGERQRSAPKTSTTTTTKDEVKT